MMRRLALVAVLLLAPGLVHAQELACGPDGREIVAVDFSGNLRFTGGELENAIVTTPSSWLRRVLHIPVGAQHCLDSLELLRDEVRLRLYYRLRGLYKTTVDAAVTPQSPTDSDKVRVQFNLVEGPPVIIDTLDVSGLDSVPRGIRDRALRLLTPFRNRTYNKLLLQAAADSVVTLLQNTGYAYAAEPLRDISVDNATDRASVSLTFLPGHRAHIAQVNYSLQGNEPNEPPKIDSTTVRRLLSFNTGDLYRQQD
ncbi:MAG: POTRA domain-containing protein, partial [Gemmatimonadaceae bacterium]